MYAFDSEISKNRSKNAIGGFDLRGRFGIGLLSANDMSARPTGGPPRSGLAGSYGTLNANL